MSFTAYVQNKKGDSVYGTLFNLSEHGLMQSINRYNFDPRILNGKLCKHAARIIKKFLIDNILTLTEFAIKEWVESPGFPNDMENWISYNTFAGIYKRLLDTLSKYPDHIFI